MSSLASRRKSTTVPEAAVAAQIHKTLDVHRHFTAEVTLHFVVLVDALTKLADISVVQLLRALVLWQTRLRANLRRGVRTNAINIL